MATDGRDRRIRPADAADQPAIVGCVRAAYARYRGRMEREPAPLHADYAALIARGVVYVLAPSDSATDGPDDEVCGILVMWPQDDGLLVENVAVAPRYQGQGLGRMLMAFAERTARAQQRQELRLYTNEVMRENLRFYRLLGFEELDRREEDGYRRVFLRKVLG